MIVSALNKQAIQILVEIPMGSALYMIMVIAVSAIFLLQFTDSIHLIICKQDHITCIADLDKTTKKRFQCTGRRRTQYYCWSLSHMYLRCTQFFIFPDQFLFFACTRSIINFIVHYQQPQRRITKKADHRQQCKQCVEKEHNKKKSVRKRYIKWNRLWNIVIYALRN